MSRSRSPRWSRCVSDEMIGAIVAREREQAHISIVLEPISCACCQTRAIALIQCSILPCRLSVVEEEYVTLLRGCICPGTCSQTDDRHRSKSRAGPWSLPCTLETEKRARVGRRARESLPQHASAERSTMRVPIARAEAIEATAGGASMEKTET